MKKIRMLAILLIAVILLESTGLTGLQPVAASQADKQMGTTIWTNPLLSETEQAACKKQLNQPPNQQSVQDNAVDATGSGVCSSMRAAAIYLRKQLKARASTVWFQLDGNCLPQIDTASTYDQVLEEALKPTTDPQEGDYIRYQLVGYSTSAPVNDGMGIVTYQMNFRYYTTAYQERKVMRKIKNVVTSLNLGNNSDAEKIKKIHDYLCKNVRYYDSKKKSCHTAYSALIGKKTVCQGYATAFYALCIQAGLSTRCIQGIGYPRGGPRGNHLWNVVKLNGKWYNIDVTWDDQTANASSIGYNYFMKNNAVFNKDHRRFYYYNYANQQKRYFNSVQIAAFDKSCPMSAVSFTNAVGRPVIKSTVTVGRNAMRLTWKKVDTATGYYFYYATSLTGLNTCRPIVIKGGNVTALKMIGMVKGKTYYFKMRAYSDLFTKVKSKYSATVRLKN